MRAFLWKIVDRLGRSYWFIPLLMALAALAAAVSMIAVDRIVGILWLDDIWWLYVNQPSGARALLQVIAGSMITVAGVTFSITIATVASAASQFGPRLMTNFMNDRGNQITLGTFVATFLYCLLVLRTVRGGDGVDAADVFVPHLAIVGGLLLALASLGVLLYFIHHIPETIHISHVIARVGRELDRRIEDLYDAKSAVGDESAEIARDDTFALPLPFEDVAKVGSTEMGFVQHVESAQLVDSARKHDLVLWVVQRPGDFVTPRHALVLAKPAGQVTDAIARGLRGAFVVGDRRTPSQDILFLVNQLVEVAARALSPGTNDPITAIHCVNWLVAALGKLSGRQAPDSVHRDDAGVPRVVMAPVDFEMVADAVFAQLRPYIQTDRNAALHSLTAMIDLIPALPAAWQKSILISHCLALRRGCEEEFAHPADRQAVAEIFAAARAHKGIQFDPEA